MLASNMDLESATQSLTKDIQECVRDFESNVVILRRNSGMDEEQLKRLVQAYQVVDTATLNFSIQSPRYGILKDRQTDGSFVVTL